MHDSNILGKLYEITLFYGLLPTPFRRALSLSFCGRFVCEKIYQQYESIRFICKMRKVKLYMTCTKYSRVSSKSVYYSFVYLIQISRWNSSRVFGEQVLKLKGSYLYFFLVQRDTEYLNRICLHALGIDNLCSVFIF